MYHLPEELHASSHYKFMKNRIISSESDTDGDIITDGKTDDAGDEKMSEPEVISDDEVEPEVISNQAVSNNENDKEDDVEECSLSLNTTGITEIVDSITATLDSDESLLELKGMNISDELRDDRKITGDEMDLKSGSEKVLKSGYENFLKRSHKTITETLETLPTVDDSCFKKPKFLGVQTAR